MNSSGKSEYIAHIPNRYIQENIRSRFGVSRKFYITYILIDRYRSVEDFSWITIRKVLSFYGYKTTRHKPKAFKEILDVLEYMVNNKMIEIEQDLDSINYDTGIEIRIISENFDYPDKFTRLTSRQLDTIMMADSSINKENLLMAFLYISSYIGCREDYATHSMSDAPERSPEACWRSIQNMAQDLSMSKETIGDCISYLTAPPDNSEPLLVKHEVGYIPQGKTGTPKKAPNIYVLNQKGYEREIEWALAKMREIYQVDSFVKK